MQISVGNVELLLMINLRVVSYNVESTSDVSFLELYSQKQREL